MSQNSTLLLSCAHNAVYGNSR